MRSEFRRIAGLDRCFRFVSLSFVVFLFLVLTSSSIEAQFAVRPDAKRPFRENATLPVDSNLLKRFGTVEDLLSDHRWTEAIGVLQEIAQTESKSLVLVRRGKVGEVATYLNVATRCSVLLSRIPAEGRASYRQKVDPQAKRWFEGWQRTRDEAELLRIVRQNFVSSYTDDALWALGELAWDQGDLSAARSWWEQMIPLADDAIAANYPTVLRYPDTEFDVAAIKARMILSFIVEGEFERAKTDLLKFSDDYPQAEGRIAGQTGRLVDILWQVIVDSRNWKVSHSVAEVATFGLSPARYQQIPETVDVGALRWVRSLPSDVLPNQLGRLPFHNETLSYHPVVYDNGHEQIVIVNDPDAIRAWNILTGEPAWASERNDPAVIYPVLPDEPTMISKMKCVGIPHYTMTLANGRLYARMGSPVTCSSNVELQRDFGSDLVCLDLTQQGKLVWKIAAHELFPNASTWRYEGTPLVVAGKAYVAVCRRHPQLELMIACLDATDGRLIWQRPLGAFRVSVDDSRNRISHLLLTSGGGRIFLSTDVGAILAMDAHDGRLEWAISYESRSEDSPEASTESSRIGLNPALFHAGYLFAAPTDSNSAYCIEADSGKVHWQFRYVRNQGRDEAKQLREKQWRHLLGVVSGGMAGRLIVSGQSIWAIDVNEGKVVWSPGDSALTRGAKGPFGRGLIAGDQVLVPMRESIEVFDVQSGALTRTVPLKTSDSSQQGGNLTLAAGMLLVAQPNRLSAYCEYSQLKERYENELTLQPDDVESRMRLAELEASEGRFESAFNQFRHLLNQVQSENPIGQTVRKKFSKLLHDTGSAEFRGGKTAEAREHWLEAVSITDEPAKNVELRFELARVAEALDNPERAIADLQEILGQERLSNVLRNNSTSGAEAANVISRIISERGRNAYREIEAAATAEFDQLAKVADRSGLHRLIGKYPNSNSASNARSLLVQLHRDAREIPEAFAILSEIRRKAADDREYVEASLMMAELLEHSRYENSAKRMWHSLANHKPEIQNDLAGKKIDFGRLARIPTKDPLDQPQSNHFERTWSHEFPADVRIIVPQGEPVSRELASVLICFKDELHVGSWQWKCFDWQTGKTRWETTASDPIMTAAWTPVQLMIGSAHGWQARATENGRKVWEQRCLAETTPYVVSEKTWPGEEVTWPTIFDVEQGLQILDPNDGNSVTNLKPPGRLNGDIAFGKLMLQTDRFGATGEKPESNVRDQEPDRTEVASGSPDATVMRGSPDSTVVRGSPDPAHDSGRAPDPAQGVDGSLEGFSDAFVVMMQTVKPTRAWRATAISPRDRWSVVELPEHGVPWQGFPLILGKRLIGIANDQSLVGYPIEGPRNEPGTSDDLDAADVPPPSNIWSYRNFSIAHASPVAFEIHGQLFVTVDGSQLTSFDPKTGNRKWSTGLTDVPMKVAAQQVATDGNSVFVTGQGVLRAISIEDGSVRFEHYLGDTSQQWHTAIAWADRSNKVATNESHHSVYSRATVVATWPITPGDGNRYVIRFCDGNTGAILQQFRFNSEPRGISMDAEGQGIIWTDRRIIGLRSSSQTLAVENVLKSGNSRP